MKKVLVLGAGLVARPLVDYLLGLEDFSVVVADVEFARAEKLVADAHIVCPYSNATRNNVEVSLTVVGVGENLREQFAVDLLQQIAADVSWSSQDDCIRLQCFCF